MDGPFARVAETGAVESLLDDPYMIELIAVFRGLLGSSWHAQVSCAG